MKVITRSIYKRCRALEKVAYLLDVFPQLSETFILNEIVQLMNNGVKVAIFSRKKPREKIHHAKAEELMKQTRYLSENDVSRLKKIWLHLYFFITSPIRYLKTFLFSYRNSSFWHFKQSVIYAKEIKSLGAQHIHSHYAASTATEYAMLVSMLSGIPYTFTAHGWYDIFTYPPSDFNLRAERAKAVVTVSNFNRNYILKRFNIPSEKVYSIHCGIDISFFNNLRHIEKDEKLILSVARLHPVKGLDYLVKACDILKNKGLSFKCVIVGEGSEKENLRKLILQRELKSYVELAGAKVQDEILKYYHKARIFVLPSVTEGLPVTLMEAMACKIPVVATKICGIPELVEDGVNGFLVPPKDPQRLADAIEVLLKDSELCRRFGEEGRRKVEREFNLEKQVKKLIELWES